ncbi:7859_t:CDS:1, partial [Acaulospora colombiana]
GVDILRAEVRAMEGELFLEVELWVELGIKEVVVLEVELRIGLRVVFFRFADENVEVIVEVNDECERLDSYNLDTVEI